MTHHFRNFLFTLTACFAGAAAQANPAFVLTLSDGGRVVGFLSALSPAQVQIGNQMVSTPESQISYRKGGANANQISLVLLRLSGASRNTFSLYYRIRPLAGNAVSGTESIVLAPQQSTSFSLPDHCALTLFRKR